MNFPPSPTFAIRTWCYFWGHVHGSVHSSWYAGKKNSNFFPDIFSKFCFKTNLLGGSLEDWTFLLVSFTLKLGLF